MLLSSLTARLLLRVGCESAVPLTLGYMLHPPQIAKAAAVSAYESSVATRGGLSQAIGRQLLAHGRFDRAEFASKVAALRCGSCSRSIAFTSCIQSSLRCWIP